MGNEEVIDETAGVHVEEAHNATISPDMTNEMSLTIWQTIKTNPKTIFYCLLLALGPMVYGFDIIVVSLAVAMPSFRLVFGTTVGTTTIIPAIWLALWNSMIQVGAMAGSAVSGFISDRFGRKVTFILGASVAVVAIFVVYFSDRVESLTDKRVMFLMGKIIVGFAFGLINASYLTMVSEIAPTRIRGPLLSCLTFFTILAQIAAVSLVYDQINILTPSSYRIVFASQWGMAGAAVIAGFLIPESPVYLIKRNNLAGALKSYKRLYSHADPEVRVAALQTIVEHEMMAEKSRDSMSYVQCFRGTNFRRTRIIIYANIMQQFVGISMITSSTYFLQLGGMTAALALTLNLVHLVIGLPLLMIAFFLMTIYGRRSLFLWGTSFGAVLWLGFGIAGCFPDSKQALLFLGIQLIIIYADYALCIGSVAPVIAAESSSVHLRAASQSVGFFSQFIFSWLFQFVVPYIFNTDAGNLGGKTGFIFAFLCVGAFFLVWFEVPETKNRTFAELDEMFEKNVSTRAFGDYTCSGIEVPFSKAEEAGEA